MTAFLLVFGVALLLAVLTSGLAARSALSTSMVFLAVGIAAGPLGFSLVDVSTHGVEGTAEIALFAILFTDGQHAPVGVLRRRWREPSLALAIGMPATFVIVAALAHWLVGMSWLPALVVGAVLAPTDPVFASALVGRDDVPRPVRDALNIESGLNDGLALPAVLLLAGIAGGSPAGWSTDPGPLALAIATGIALGIGLPLAVNQVLRLPGVGADPHLQPLGPLAVAILLYATCRLVDANQFLAAFVAGSTIATVRPVASDAFRRTGELVSELAKGAALLAFASLLEPSVFRAAGIVGVVFALGVVAISRPLPIVALLSVTALARADRWAIAWFGPKGFASVAYAVIVAYSGMQSSAMVLTLVTVTVLLSVVAHSSTDVAVAGRLARSAGERQQGHSPRATARSCSDLTDRTGPTDAEECGPGLLDPIADLGGRVVSAMARLVVSIGHAVVARRVRPAPGRRHVGATEPREDPETTATRPVPGRTGRGRDACGGDTHRLPPGAVRTVAGPRAMRWPSPPADETTRRRPYDADGDDRPGCHPPPAASS